MKTMINRIKNSEFLTFNEVLRLKVAIVTIFLFVFVTLSIPLSTYNNFTDDVNILIPIGFGLLLALTLLLTLINLNRWAMHFSIYIIIGLTIFYVGGTDYFYGYILFFVTLTVIIFYQDIITYLLYGGGITIYGIYYIMENGSTIVGINSTGVEFSSLTYQIILIGFYLVFLIQFIISDNIYEKMNNEWVKMNKVLEKYQAFSLQYLKEHLEDNEIDPLYKNSKFQQVVSELSVFINEFFEEDGNKIAEVVEFYFFLHDQEIENIIGDKELPFETRKYAIELQKYLINSRSELVSILFDFATLFKGDKKFQETRYEYSLEKLFENKIDKLLALSILYKYLKTEVTQYDKWGKVARVLTHEEITELFVSKEFREFISFEQVNFYLDNQELFEKYL
ncbi:MAG: hypothetical protein KQ78_00502 [Candidatus Izimaplasma bacterium HR2]|nr:MAG: hypothetical protein KQ78_00502 [Candidatus Izimaplasma bacterium HR2]